MKECAEKFQTHTNVDYVNVNPVK
eukprot:SAG11_NODE_8221_length_1045_cov_1.086681_2_plen_23_part_01